MLLVLLALACAPKPVAPEAPVAAEAPAAEAPAAEPAPAPAEPAAEPTISPPVTLEAFRAAFPAGTKIRLRIEVAGKPPVEDHWEWTAVDAEGGTISSKVYAADGTLISDEGEQRSEWTELMGHADFPADRTVMTESSVTVPAGTFDTWLFTMTGADDAGRPEVRRFHFAKTMPGPPVLFTIEQGGAEVFRMTLLERTPMPTAPTTP